MKNAPKRAKKCARCAVLTKGKRAAKAAPQALVAQKAEAVHIRQTRPRCSRSLIRTKTASSAKTNSWRWQRPSASICGGPADREVRKVRDSKVADQVAPKDTHDSRVAGRQVHQMARASKAAVAKIAVLPAVQKVVASSAAASTVHRHGVATIVNDLQAHPKVVGPNDNVSNAAPMEVDLSVSDSLVRAAVNSNATALLAHHTDAVSIAIASPVRPNIGVSNANDTRAAQKENDMNAIGMLVLREATGWTATASPDHPINMASIATAMPVRPSIVASMVRVLPVHHVLHSIRV
jgi:hypothetical protein